MGTLKTVAPNFQKDLKNLGNNFFTYSYNDTIGTNDLILFKGKHNTIFAYTFAYNMDFVKVYVPYVDPNVNNSMSAGIVLLFPFKDVWVTPNDIIVTDAKQRTITYPIKKHEH